ncbi:tetratricopeptide repeat protein [Mucilaginibacter glaciei]|uniref:Tetratricopeptide repeat protein n=1 Tax=Mucilaginibacter glaciei TaxID=2772109 RepID=A0A926NNB5_9SPHI|nr:tetratricopeptide repeat protein [Mucilaginibacter glaciei]MBD1392896.1 tetratricopeptide repeat protein [Mucilaginibacter glaciei]
MYKPTLFEQIKALSKGDRVEPSRIIYKKSCREMTEEDAMQSLNDLSVIANTLDDKQLQCAVFDMRSDYYSVNKGYNQLSTKLFDDAIQYAKDQKLKAEIGIYMHRKAIYYFVYKQNTQACRYFLLSQDEFRKVGFNNIPNIGGLFSETADFYYSLGDFDNARYNLKNALLYQDPLARNRINIINTIGLTYRNAGHYSVAMQYFNQAFRIAKERKDSVWVTIAEGNIGSVYFLQHNYAKALPLIKADYQNSQKYELFQNSAIALLRLIRIDIDSHDYKQAAIRLDTANILLSKAPENVLIQRVDYYELRSILNERTGNPAESNVYRIKFEHARDSVAKRDNMTAIERVRLSWEMDKNRAELNKIKTDSEIENYKQNTIIIVLSLLIIISMLLYNRQRLKANRDQELLAIEKLRLDDELRNAKLALHGFTENLMQKNILIEEFKTEVDRLQLKSDDADGASILEKMLQAHIMTDENWQEFKKLFTKAHPTFLYNLRNKFEHLTNTDVRLLALLKLRLNNREIAGMLGITTDGVKKAKQRLRKKMDLQQDTDIDEVLTAI